MGQGPPKAFIRARGAGGLTARCAHYWSPLQGSEVLKNKAVAYRPHGSAKEVLPLLMLPGGSPKNRPQWGVNAFGEVPGAEHDSLSQKRLGLFCGGRYLVSPDSDRSIKLA